MKITERVLAEAWRRALSGYVLFDGVGLPPVAHSEEELKGMGGGGLCLLLEEDGTVHGRHGPHREVFVARDLGQALYLIAETVAVGLGGGPEEVAEALERVDPGWGRRFRGGGPDDTEEAGACGRDPLEGLAWVAGSWREQDPYTTLAFFRAAPGRTVDAERLALLYGADPAQVAAGTRLKDLPAVDDGWSYADRQWESCCFGEAGGWTFLLHHDTPPEAFADEEAYAALGIEESVWLTATSAKAMYSFTYLRNDRHVADDDGMWELNWYERGHAPHVRGGELDFLNRAVRRAELDHPELTDPFELYFHALEDSLGLRLPRRDFTEGEVRAAYWAGEAW
ncbi:hypothetical protein [Streptomyces sp. NPDC098101]|uniref:hypothetical protein n=1 Tax=Streptomyces sp. NPDC098101 TaxID=3366096 RepID=UPI003800A275